MEGKVYDIKVAGKKYKNKAGKECTEWNRAGVAFDAKDGDGGKDCRPFNNISISGPFIIRERQEKTAAAAPEPEMYDDGADFLE
jgi:hypothetical protein